MVILYKMNLKTLQKFACTLKFDCVNIIILIQMLFKTLAGMHTNNQGSRMTQGTSRKGPPGQRRQQNDIPSHLSYIIYHWKIRISPPNCHISYIIYHMSYIIGKLECRLPPPPNFPTSIQISGCHSSTWEEGSF